MEYRIIRVTPLEQNCTLLWCPNTRAAAVVDPGGDVTDIVSLAQQEKVKLTKILITHGHIDHAGGAAELARRLALPIFGPHAEDRFWIDQLPQQSQMFRLPFAESFTPHWLNDGDTVTVGEQTLQVLHTPGHTPGHICFFHALSQLALVGDVLFAGSIGRSDFPRGDYAALIASIRGKLWPLGNEVQFVPGHGAMSTFGRERNSNPYVADGV